MSTIRDQWRIVQRHPAPTCYKHPDGDPISCGWKHAYRELVASLPRPIKVELVPISRLFAECSWRWRCALCDHGSSRDSQQDALHDGLDHLHRDHGCPSWQASGEPCTDACEDCNGWGWVA